MKVESVKLVCFSPTGTSKAVVQGIASGIDSIPKELIDITTPEARIRGLPIKSAYSQGVNLKKHMQLGFLL